MNRRKCFKKLFGNPINLKKAYVEFGSFSSGSEYFNPHNVIEARLFEEPIF